MSQRYVTWSEPMHFAEGPTDWVNLECRVSVEGAIAFQRATLAKRGFLHVSDQDALDDFVLARWARIVEADE